MNYYINMNCNKTKQRTLFNMFEIFSCSKCENSYYYEYIYIGNNVINMYKLNNECINIIKKQKMINLFFKESIINEKDLFLILTSQEYNYLFDYFPLLLEDTDLYILII